jgi:hypothetical protein
MNIQNHSHLKNIELPPLPPTPSEVKQAEAEKSLATKTNTSITTPSSNGIVKSGT